MEDLNMLCSLSLLQNINVYNLSRAEAEIQQISLTSSNEGGRYTIVRCQGLAVLAQVLRQPSRSAWIIHYTTLTVFNISQSVALRANIVEANWVPLLVELLTCGQDGVALSAARTLEQLSLIVNHCSAAITSANAIPTLVYLLNAGQGDISGVAASTLSNLAKSSGCPSAIVQAGAIDAGVKVLKAGPKQADQWKVLDLVCQFSTQAEFLPALVKTDLAQVLAAMLQDMTGSTIRPAVACLLNVLNHCWTQEKQNTQLIMAVVNARGAVAALLKLVAGHEDQVVRLDAGNALMTLTACPASCKIVGSKAGIQALVSVVGNSKEDDSVRMSAVGAVGNICICHPTQMPLMVAAGLVKPVVQLTSNMSQELICALLGVLSHLVQDPIAQTAVVIAGATQALMKLLNETDQDVVRRHVADAITNITFYVPTQCKAFRDAGAVRLLLSMLSTQEGEGDTRRSAIGALENLIDDDPQSGDTVIEWGIIDPMLEMLNSGSQDDSARAASVCVSLGVASPTRADKLRRAGVVPVLKWVRQLQALNQDSTCMACAALLVLDSELAVAERNSYVSSIIEELTSAASQAVQLNVVDVLRRVAADSPSNRDLVVEAGGLTALNELAATGASAPPDRILQDAIAVLSSKQNAKIEAECQPQSMYSQANHGAAPMAPHLGGGSVYPAAAYPQHSTAQQPVPQYSTAQQPVQHYGAAQHVPPGGQPNNGVPASHAQLAAAAMGLMGLNLNPHAPTDPQAPGVMHTAETARPANSGHHPDIFPGGVMADPSHQPSTGGTQTGTAPAATQLPFGYPPVVQHPPVELHYPAVQHVGPMAQPSPITSSQYPNSGHYHLGQWSGHHQQPFVQQAHHPPQPLQQQHQGHYGHAGHPGNPGHAGHPGNPGHPGHPGNPGHPGHPGNYPGHWNHGPGPAVQGMAGYPQTPPGHLHHPPWPAQPTTPAPSPQGQTAGQWQLSPQSSQDRPAAYHQQQMPSQQAAPPSSAVPATPPNDAMAKPPEGANEPPSAPPAPAQQQQTPPLPCNVSPGFLKQLTPKPGQIGLLIQTANACAQMDPTKITPVLLGMISVVCNICNAVLVCKVQAERLRQRLEVLRPCLEELGAVIADVPPDGLVRHLVPVADRIHGVILEAQALLEQLPQHRSRLVRYIQKLVASVDHVQQLEEVNRLLSEVLNDLNTCVSILHLSKLVKEVPQGLEESKSERLAGLQEDVKALPNQLVDAFEGNFQELKDQLQQNQVDVKTLLLQLAKMGADTNALTTALPDLTNDLQSVQDQTEKAQQQLANELKAVVQQEMKAMIAGVEGWYKTGRRPGSAHDDPSKPSKLPVFCIDRADVEKGPDSYQDRGGFGEVHKAVYKGLEVAVKVFANRSKMDKSMERKLLKEAYIMNKASVCPGVVKLYGVIVDPEQGAWDLALVSEFIKGQTLYEAVHDEFMDDLPYRQQVQWCLEAARTVQFLHDFPRPHGPIVHGDLKTQNFMVMESNQHLKLLDFGCAAISNTTSSLLATTISSAGTVRPPASLSQDDFTYSALYTAPEIWGAVRAGRLVKRSTASDVFALGMLFYEICMRMRPFDDRNFVEGSQVEAAVCGGQRPALADLRDDHPEMAEVIDMCWAQDPAERPDARKVCDYLEAAFKAAPME